MNKTISFLVFTLSFLLSINTTAMAQNKKTNILVLIHSDNGGTYELAKNITEGIEKNSDANATIKLVKASDNVKLKDIPVANVDELSSYDGIAFGSPVYFGNISTAMSEFLSKTVDVWTKHELEGMPATVFITTKKRSILFYIMEPLLKNWDRALRE